MNLTREEKEYLLELIEWEQSNCVHPPDPNNANDKMVMDLTDKLQSE